MLAVENVADLVDSSVMVWCTVSWKRWWFPGSWAGNEDADFAQACGDVLRLSPSSWAGNEDADFAQACGDVHGDMPMAHASVRHLFLALGLTFAPPFAPWVPE